MYPILMYHALRVAGDDSDPHLADPAAQPYILDVGDFERQMQLFAHSPQPELAWDSIVGRRTFIMTFDDGHRSNAELALPILTRLGLRAVFFITTDWIGRAGYMSESQIRELAAAGMLIGSHGRSHRYLSDVNDSELDSELRGSKARLENLLGVEVPAMSLPGGRSSARVLGRAEAAGYRILMTSRIALASPEDNALDMPRVPVTRNLDLDFFRRLLDGDDSDVRRMARSAGLRNMAKHLLGNRLYDRLRVVLLGK